MKVRFLRLSYFVWVIVPLGLLAAYEAFGLPHMIWSYDFYSTSDEPFVGRTYTRCTFIGPYGAFTTRPADGKCAWVAFFKDREGD